MRSGIVYVDHLSSCYSQSTGSGLWFEINNRRFGGWRSVGALVDGDFDDPKQRTV